MHKVIFSNLPPMMAAIKRGDIEHEEFHPLVKWEEFITDPGKYLNGMIEGEFEE